MNNSGNFPANDLQQVSTGLVDLSQQSARVVAEICSVYPERNEALVNAGVVALSRETSAYPGFGLVADNLKWGVVRLSQEHGIIGRVDNAESSEERTSIGDDFTIGQKVSIYCQHACITAAAFPEYHVVDDNDIVEETWVPWKNW